MKKIEVTGWAGEDWTFRIRKKNLPSDIYCLPLVFKEKKKAINFLGKKHIREIILIIKEKRRKRWKEKPM